MTAVMLGIPKQRKRFRVTDLVTEEEWNALSEMEFQRVLSDVMTINSLLFRQPRPENPVIGDCYTDTEGGSWMYIGGEWILLGRYEGTVGLDAWLVFGYQS